MCTLDSVATEFQDFLLFEKGLETGNLQKNVQKILYLNLVNLVSL